MVLASLLFTAHAISFKLLSSDPICIKIKGGQSYVLYYVSSG